MEAVAEITPAMLKKVFINKRKRVAACIKVGRGRGGSFRAPAVTFSMYLTVFSQYIRFDTICEYLFLWNTLYITFY